MNEQPLALVTGAAHRLGKTFALTLARRGYAILLHYHHSGDKAAITADEIRAFGVPVYLAQADLTDATNLFSLLSVLDSLPHRIKILVNSASVMKRTDIRTTTSEEWDATFAINLRAPFMLAQQAAERMWKGGLIINVTDIAAQKLWTGYPAYMVSKVALETLTRLLGKTYAPNNIRVNAIAPGLVLPSEDITPEEWEKLVERLPLNALLFLLDTPSITGQTIVVDGGYSLD
jgi:pteridine reductase